MVLDSCRTPETHFLSSLYDIDPFMDNAVIEVPIATEWSPGLAIILILGR